MGFAATCFRPAAHLTSKAFVIQGTRSVLAFAEAERICLAGAVGFEPTDPIKGRRVSSAVD